mmetsp:Transcript_18156/g.41839  ORF Transcript_18156/g.41839 Transcript_18156/m.41839 type:complete len:230 (-) Transcript_18156:2208-2897(-)
MDMYSADSVNKLSSYETEGLPCDFFVDEYTIDRQHERYDGVNSFPMHRKLLRRRHVRKLQKTKERERQRKQEERKKKEINRDYDQKHRFEENRDLHDKKIKPGARLSAKRSLQCMGMIKVANSTASPASVRSENFIGANKTIVKNTVSNCLSSPTSVLGFQRMNIFTVTESPEPNANVDLLRKLRGTTSDMALTMECIGYKEERTHCRSSFSLPGFSPVRPTKFRKLQL